MSVLSLFLCVGFLNGADLPGAQAPAAREDGWVIVRKPLYNLLPTSRVVIPAGTVPQSYTKRAVSQSGETLPVQTGTLVGSPTLAVDRITVTGGRVEITAESIVIEGGRAEIVRQPGR